MIPERSQAQSKIEASPKRSVKKNKQRKNAVRIAVSGILIFLNGCVVFMTDNLAYEARISLFAFIAAMILWVVTSLPPAYVAVSSVLFIILAGGQPETLLYSSLSSDLIWLMAGTFIIGGALQKTGLAERFTEAFMNRAKTIQGLFWLMTAALLPLTFFIPSTSGRAAVTVPVFQSLARRIDHAEVKKAMSLAIPVIILVSTISTVIGAGSHLIAVNMLKELTGESITFLQWLLWGLPFGAAASFLSCWIIMLLFLGKEWMKQEIQQQTEPANQAEKLSSKERVTVITLFFMLMMWMTEHYHNLELPFVTMLGAMVLMLPKYGVLSWKEGLSSISWNLIIFVGAAIALGNALIDSQTIHFLTERLFSLTKGLGQASTFFLLIVLAAITLTSHLYITSHTTRAIVMIPPLIFLAGSLDVSAAAVLFIGTAGMNYCLTFPVSSKALMLYYELEMETFRPKDLVKLSFCLLIFHFLLMIVFYYGYWKWTGLSL